MSDTQTSFATLGTSIGIVSQLNGSATAQSIDGQERSLKIGDPIFFGETIVTASGSNVIIDFIDGTNVSIGSDTAVEITDEVYNTGDAEGLVADSVAEAEALQAAILAGADPTAIQDAPAAGVEDQERFDANVERNEIQASATGGVDTSSTLPTYGYDTETSSSDSESTVDSSLRTTSGDSSLRTTSSNSSLRAASSVASDSINQSPVIEEENISITEDTTISGNVTASDADLPSGSSLVFTTTSKVEGFTFNSDGSYIFDASSYDSLVAGETQTLQIPVTVSDDQGATDTTTLTITVTGTNDLPIAQASSGFVSEDTNLVGEINATDVDLPNGTSLSFTTDSNVVGLTLNADGSYSFDASSYDSLAVGETQTIEIPVTVTDDQGGTDTTTLTITVFGTNDAPVAQAAVGFVIENTSIVGTVDATDLDLPDGASLLFTTDSDVAGLTLNSNGSYSFDASSYVSLGAGETQSIEIPVTVTDDQGATDTTTLTITVFGTNNGPVASADVDANAAEGGDAISGVVTATDADGDDLSYSVSGVTPAGFVLIGNTWAFDPTNDAYNGLAAGETTDVEVTVEVADGNGGTDTQTITITVTGTNDAPVAAADVVDTATEGGVSIGGTLEASDADGDALTYSVSGETPAGFTLTGNVWAFDPTNDAYNGLAAGETTDVEVTVEVADGNGGTDTQTITITVTGTNDAPVAIAETASVTEDTTIKGSIEGFDVDGETLVFTTESDVEGLTLNADGTYEFDAGSYDSLEAGETQEIVVPVTVTDDQGATTTTSLTITVTGTNDAAVIAGDTNVEADETDSILTVSGALTSSDVDNADNAFNAASIVGTNGTFSISTDGAWTFTANSAFDELDAGDSEVESFTVTSIDGTEQIVTITINGTDDASVITGDVDGLVVEESSPITLTTSGSVSVTDADEDDSPVFVTTNVASTEGNLGQLTINSDGEWSYSVSNEAVQYLGKDETKEETFTVYTTDGNSEEITVTISGTDDDSVVNTTATLSINEDFFIPITQNLEITDIDQNDSPSFADTVLQGTYGTLTLTSGQWTYQLDTSTTQFLDVGETVDDAFNLVASDGTTQSVTVTINGAEDGSVISGDFTGSLTEGNEGDSANTVSGSVSISDVDASDMPEFADVTVNGEYGSLSLVDGNWTYTVDESKVQALESGVSVTDTVTITASDNTSQDIVITINGTDDVTALTLTPLDVVEDTTEAGDAVATFTVSDADDTVTVDFTDGTNTNGYYAIEGSNVVLTEAGEAYLNGGNTLPEFSLTTSGSSTSQTLEGTPSTTLVDDATVLTLTAESVTEDATEAGDAIATFTLSDEDDVVTVGFTDGTNTSGYYAIEGNEVVLTEAGKAYLDAGNALPEVSLTTEGSSLDITVTTTPTTTLVNDAPEVSADNATVSEQGLEFNNTTDSVTTSGSFTVSDSDSDNLTVSLQAPTTEFTSNGELVVWTTDENGDLVGSADGTEVIRVTLGDITNGEGTYVVTLSEAIDQEGDSSSIDFGLVVTDGEETTTETLTVNVVDATPNSVTTTGTLTLSSVASTFSIASITSGFSDAEFKEGSEKFGTSSTENSDSDSYDEVLSWGNNDGYVKNNGSKTQVYDAGESSVEAREVNVSSDIGFGDSTIVASITHTNDGLVGSYGGQTVADSFDSALFNVDVTMIIDGQEVTVTLSSSFAEIETSNDLVDSGDSLTLDSSSTTVEVNGVSYTVYLDGFLVDGEIVNTVTTAEEVSVTYSVAAHVELTDTTTIQEEYVLTGTLETDAGADGLDSVVEATTIDDNGTLVVNEDGTYSFTPSDAFVATIGSTDSETVEYTYSVVDGDGDTVENTLSITVTGSNYGNTAPQAVDDSSSDISSVSGLNANFYNYDQDLSGNLTDIASARVVIATQSANASWVATEINYQEEWNDLGGEGNLATWIGDDAESLVYYDEQTSGDAVVELTGSVYLDAGSYDIKVEADDGYEIIINGEIVASVDYNQSSATNTFTFDVSDAGNQTIEIIYWDQGGAYELNISLAEAGSNNYETLGSDSYPTFSSPSDDFLDTSSNQAINISLDDLLANDIDADGDELSVTSISNITNGYAYLNSDGGITFVPTSGFSGVATFDYTITDGNGGYSTATASIDVADTGVLLPTVTVTVSEGVENISSSDSESWTGFSEGESYDHYDNGDYDQWVGFTGDSENVHIEDDVKAYLDTKDGDDQVVIGDDIYSSGGIQLGAGDDKLLVRDDVNGSVDAGTGDDEIVVGGDVTQSMTLGEGNNTLSVGGTVSANVNAGSGDDSVSVSGDVTQSMGLGDGDNKLSVEGSVSGAINTGSGMDDIYIAGDANAYIGTSAGDDTLTVDGDVGSNITIQTGSGDDFVVIKGNLNSNAYLDGGNDTDSIVLENYTVDQYNLDIDNIKTRVVNFENIMVGGVVVAGDAAAFTDYLTSDNTSSTETTTSNYSYAVTVDIDNTDATAGSTIVSLFGIPTTASLVLDGVPLDVNMDGSYSIEVAAGEISIENLSIQSDIELPDLDITSEVSANLDDAVDIVNDSYLEGTDGLDTLVGDLGDDVLFGGNDEVTDVLTGADGSDIFILNDVEDQSNIDTIVDFNASEDSLDLTDLLTGIEGSPDKDASFDAITEFLEAHITVTDGAVKVDDEDVANFIEETSSFDSNGDGAVNSTDSIKVIYNNEEYSIHIDG